MPAPHRSATRAPAPLVAAACLAALEALVLVIQGVAELISLSGARLTMGVTTTVFFIFYGVGLAVCAWGLTKLRSWARAPVVVAQLIQLLVAGSFWGQQTVYLAVALGLVAVLVLVGVFLPASVKALSEDTA